VTDAAYPVPTAAPEPVAAPAVPPQAPPRRGRAVGATSFVLSLVAFVGDIAGGIVFIIAIVSAIGSLTSYFDQSGGGGDLSGAAGAVIFVVVAFLGGTLLALVGIILGIVAAATRRGRVLGVFGIILGALVLVSRIVFVVLVATTAASAPDLNGVDLNGLSGLTSGS
jgi:hypothetical protein